MSKPFHLTLLLIIFFSTFGSAAADEVRLKNGDRITGRVVSMQKKALIIDTTYAGKLTIEWSEVSNLTSEKPITVTLDKNVSLEGTAESTEAGKLKLKQEKVQEPATVLLSDITGINPTPEPAVRISARVNAGLGMTDGNTNNQSIYFDGQFTARTQKNKVSLFGEYNREESDGNTTANSMLGSIKYDHFFYDKWYGYAITSAERDDFKDLNLRTDIGAGPGYLIFESARLNLGLEGGLSYVNEDFINAEDNKYLAGRWAIDYDQYFYAKLFQLFLYNEGFIDTEDADNIWIRTRTGVRIPFYKNLNLTAQYNLDWDNQPADDKEKTDQQFVFTLGYSYDN